MTRLWFSLSSEAFMVIEDTKLRYMIAALSADAAELLPKSGKTIGQGLRQTTKLPDPKYYQQHGLEPIFH